MQAKKIVIALTELLRKPSEIANDSGDIVEAPLLLNVDYMMTSRKGDFQRDKIPILNSKKSAYVDATVITLGTGRDIFVKDTVEEIGRKIADAQR